MLEEEEDNDVETSPGQHKDCGITVSHRLYLQFLLISIVLWIVVDGQLVTENLDTSKMRLLHNHSFVISFVLVDFTPMIQAMEKSGKKTVSSEEMERFLVQSGQMKKQKIFFLFYRTQS